LKIPTEEAILAAAPAMAALVEGPCWLVPVPASNGTLTANLALARTIAELVYGARVKCAIGRAHPVQSSKARSLRGLPRLTIQEHAIVRIAGPMHPLPVYFVDNVITTGTTIAACRRALGWGIGLAYADASTPYCSAAAREVHCVTKGLLR
jgi:predicted amidophosphoribosyltransferase